MDVCITYLPVDICSQLQSNCLVIIYVYAIMAKKRHGHGHYWSQKHVQQKF